MFKRGLATVAKPSQGTNWPLAIGIPVVLAGGAYYYSMRTPAPKVPALDGEWKEFNLKQIIQVNHNSSIFRFELPAGTSELGLPVASCISARYESGKKHDGTPSYVIRPYTPIDETSSHFDLVVKEYPNGKMSKHIHALKVGDTLEIKGPNKKIDYVPNEVKEIGMIAGGTGAAPMVQVIRKIFSDSLDKTKVNLVFANISEQDILLKEYFDKLQKDHPNQFSVTYVLDKAPKGSSYLEGYINATILKETMPLPGQGKVFICGPPGMVQSIAGPKTKDFKQGEVDGILKGLGYTSADVFKF